MRRRKKSSSSFMVAFIAAQLFIVFFYIHHQSSLIDLNLQHQKHENTKRTLIQKKRSLTNELHRSHDLTRIKDYALQANMKKITLDQIKSVPNEHRTT